MKSLFCEKNNDIVVHERIISYENLDQKSFSNFIKEKRESRESPSWKKNLTTRELADRLNINYEQFRKILNMNKPTKKRDCIIAICAALGLSPDETDEALVLYQYMPVLDAVNPRDDLIIDILCEQDPDNPLTIAEINHRLIRNGYPELDIIDHRPSSKSMPSKRNLPFKLLKKKVSTFLDDLFLGNQFDSLDAEYSINRYRCVAEMWLEDDKQKKGYHLIADTFANYHMQVYDYNGPNFKSYKSIEDTGIFKDYYLELESTAKREFKRMLSVLNDTKNYQTRICAGVSKDALHVFAETYNYVVPELNEYYMFEYKSGSYILSVYPTSEFMRRYLSPQDYVSNYGNASSLPIVQYNSLEEITSSKDISEYHLRSRFLHFMKLKKQIDDLICDIKEKKRYIRRLEHIYDDRDRVCEFFHVENEYDCIIDDMGMMFAKNHAVDFSFKDCGTVSITLDDLYVAFELGFNNMNEICRVKKNLGSIEKILE